MQAKLQSEASNKILLISLTFRGNFYFTRRRFIKSFYMNDKLESLNKMLKFLKKLQDLGGNAPQNYMQHKETCQVQENWVSD